MTDAVVENEIEQIRKSPLPAYRYGFFSRSGFRLKKEYPECIFYTLNDLYNEK